MRGGCLASGLGLTETAPRPGGGKGQGVTCASWLEDSKLGNSSLCGLRTPQSPLHPPPRLATPTGVDLPLYTEARCNPALHSLSTPTPTHLQKLML